MDPLNIEIYQYVYQCSNTFVFLLNILYIFHRFTDLPIELYRYNHGKTYLSLSLITTVIIFQNVLYNT